MVEVSTCMRNNSTWEMRYLLVGGLMLQITFALLVSGYVNDEEPMEAWPCPMYFPLLPEDSAASECDPSCVLECGQAHICSLLRTRVRGRDSWGRRVSQLAYPLEPLLDITPLSCDKTSTYICKNNSLVYYKLNVIKV